MIKSRRWGKLLPMSIDFNSIRPREVVITYTPEQLDQLAEELDEGSITDDSILTTGI